MLAKFKINTALLICTAFILRLAVVNIGFISSLTDSQNNCLVKSHFSTILKRKKQFDALDNSASRQYSAVEICEEDDDDKQVKSTPFVLTHVLYSFVERVKNTLKKITPSYNFLSCDSSHRYLAFCTFRI